MKFLVFANIDVGLYKFRRELLCELLKENEVYISLPNGDYIPKLVDDGCVFIDTPVDRRGLNPVKDIKLFFRYLGILRKVKPDKVITYTIKPNIYGGLACRILKVPYYTNITGLGTAFQKENWLKKISVFLYKIALKKANVVFFENEGNRQVFIDSRIVPEKKTYRLNGAGVNLDHYYFSEYPDEKMPIRFLFIGRIMKEKGIEEFIDSAERLKAEFSNIEFDVVGPYEDDYKEVIETAVSHGVVNYYGEQSDVRPFIEKSSCFVLPSYHEGMANTLLESGAMGRPLIASNIPGCREAVSEGRNGFLCQSQDANSLYETMRCFLTLDYKNRAKMGLMSRRHMEENFDKKQVVDITVRELNR